MDFSLRSRSENFEDFICKLGAENTNPYDPYFIRNTNHFLVEVARCYDISVIRWAPHDLYNDFKFAYENILLSKGRNKSETAVHNDVNQVLVSLGHNKDDDCYLTTWDTTIHLLRNKILADCEFFDYNYFYICNPAKLSNKISLENFNIDESALTDEIFAYADKRYDISNRVKSLLEMIAPFLNEKGTGDRRLLRQLGRIRREQIELRDPEIGNEQEEKNLPVEEIFMMLIPKMEMKNDDKDIMAKFSFFMSTEENTDYIVELINRISELRNFKTYDLTEYFNKIKSIDLSQSSEN